MDKSQINLNSTINTFIPLRYFIMFVNGLAYTGVNPSILIKVDTTLIETSFIIIVENDYTLSNETTNHIKK